MSTDLPPASISGQQGWEWNDLQAQQDPQESPNSPVNRSDERGLPGRHRDHRAPHLAHRASDTRRASDAHYRSTGASRRELAAALEQKERRVQQIIDHYERVLEKKNRQLANQRETDWSDRLPPLLSSFTEYLPFR